MQVILDAWLIYWPFIFQPAIGVLMLGAVRVLQLRIEDIGLIRNIEHF